MIMQELLEPGKQLNIQKLDQIVRDLGEDVQRAHVIKNLPTLFKVNHKECLQQIFPRVQELLKVENYEFHAEASKSYLELLKKGIMSPHEFSILVLPTIIHFLHKESAVAHLWNETALELIDQLPYDIVYRKLFKLALANTKLSASNFQRVNSAKMLGRMATIFDQIIIVKEILPVVLSLSQDSECCVRGAACQQYHSIALVLPESVLKGSLIPSLIELSRDENESVRVDAIWAIVQMLPRFSADLLKSTIYPLVKTLMENAEKSGDSTLTAVAANISIFALTFRSIMQALDRVSMLKYFTDWAHLGLPAGPRRIFFHDNPNFVECRKLCAENLVGMSKFCSSDQMCSKLMVCFIDLASDPSPMVRQAVGSVINSMVQTFRDKSTMSRRVLVTLLKDTNDAVLQSFVPDLTEIILNLFNSGILGGEHDQSRTETATSILNCLKFVEKGRNWRLDEELTNQLPCVIIFASSGFIFNNFVPHVFNKMLKARPLPCRVASMRAILLYLRYTVKDSHKDKIRSRLLEEFANSHSCFERMLYIRGCHIARTLFSSVYFKEHFLKSLLRLASDSVPNNRLLVAREFVALRKLIRKDLKYKTELESCISERLDLEKDRDVIHALQPVMKPPKIEEDFDEREDQRKFDEELRIANCNSGFPWISPINTSTSESLKATERTLLALQHGQYCQPPRKTIRSTQQFKATSSDLKSGNFEREFYRDTGVPMGKIISEKKPPLLANSRRSKSFVLSGKTNPIETVNSDTRVKTKIPISHRRSMDASQLSVKTQKSKLSSLETTKTISKLPVRVVK